MADEEFRSLDEELNVQSKRVLHKWLLKAINEKDKKSFDHCLTVLGTSWSVKRSVPNDVFADFANHLWKKCSDIKAGNYKWQKDAFSYTAGSKHKRAYSYESKVCFAIAPTKYKIIYDDRTRKHLKSLQGVTITLTNFDTAVNEWLSRNNIDTTSEDALYRADYALWSGEALNRRQN